METNSMMQNENMRLAISFVIGLIVGVGGYWLIGGHSHTANDMVVVPGDEMASTTDMGSADMMTTITADQGVIVNNQAPGKTVHVSEVKLMSPGWVAIVDDVNGTPGKILGAQLFDTGTASGDVSLLRNTVEGKNYFAVLYKDDGNYHSFTPKTDIVIKDADGKPTMVTFTATADTTMPAGDSDTSTSTLPGPYINVQ